MANQVLIEVYQRQDDLFDWRLVAGNGEIVCGSMQGFFTQHDAIRGAARARILMADDPEVVTT